ncbi:TIM barrel protein [Sinomonas sp. ASV322]|uniref:sugar phosphate isomerase/epimerase family protein n=1 Tax=Sinomonas sp. ASV322 TaxID=3041920 RepID=UPI0027DC2B22|nr:TIM barrel protein [Sinomonas sp. ASV322]MDQ4501667.1 TIM barrel protein [Sinomonas sp. ASV322]
MTLQGPFPAGSAGLCSVTLRSRSLADVVETASNAGLTGIEWGTDVHVTGPDEARTAARLCAEKGLRVMSLGSYCRLGDFEDVTRLLASAKAAGTQRIRVWAGREGSDRATPALWDRVVEDAQRIARLAAEDGLEIALEYHGNTPTDTAASTVDLLTRIDRPNVRTYWQPAVGLDDAAALESFLEVSPFVSGIHCFSWSATGDRYPLRGRERLWAAVVGATAARGESLDFMLEFVVDDSREQVVDDAGTLLSLLAARAPSSSAS